MTMSEFETLRGDLAGLGGEMSALRADVTALKADVTDLKADVTDLKTDVTELKADVDNRFGTLRTELEIRFDRIEAKIDEKPSTGTIYQAALAIFAGMFTVFAGTLVALKSLGFIS
jgi:predicted  nucleic acid-binding Zn-ribbon protein